MKSKTEKEAEVWRIKSKEVSGNSTIRSSSREAEK